MMAGCCSVIGFYFHQSLVSWIMPFDSAILVSLTNTFSDWCLWLCQKLTGIRCSSAVFSEGFVHVFCNLDSLLYFYSSIFNNCFSASFHDKTVCKAKPVSLFKQHTQMYSEVWTENNLYKRKNLHDRLLQILWKISHTHTHTQMLYWVLETCASSFTGTTLQTKPHIFYHTSFVSKCVWVHFSDWSTDCSH